jgi:shikimate kinase
MSESVPDIQPCRVLLIGMMGSGKTTIGRLLSERTGWPYHDNDDLLRAAAGRSAREVLEHEDLATLRRAEADALARASRMPAPCIAGIAAGVILDPSSREALRRTGVVVWLRAEPESLAARAPGGSHRPWLDADPLGWMRAAAAERDPLYASVADMSVRTDDRQPGATVIQILAWLAATGCLGGGHAAG